MALIALRTLLQTRMRSHPVGMDVWFLVEPFVYFYTSCVRTAKALARLRGYAGSPEPSLVACVISTIISWAGSYIGKGAHSSLLITLTRPIVKFYTAAKFQMFFILLIIEPSQTGEYKSLLKGAFLTSMNALYIHVLISKLGPQPKFWIPAQGAYMVKCLDFIYIYYLKLTHFIKVQQFQIHETIWIDILHPIQQHFSHFRILPLDGFVGLLSLS